MSETNKEEDEFEGETRPKRPRLNEEPKKLTMSFQSLQCFVRHFSKCYQRDGERVRRENLMKVTLLNRSSVRAVRLLLRGFWLENKIGHEFEFQLDRGTGLQLRFSDSVTFALLNLVNPRNFRICGHFGDFGNYSRIDQLISLSRHSTELVAYKPTHKDNFVLLLESMKDHLTYLECDPKFLAISDLPVLKADYFKSSQTSGQVPLRDILRHKIKCLDLRNDSAGACIADDECPTQEALKKLMVRGSMSSTNDALSYFQDVKTFAPNLRSYEIEFEEEIPRSQTATIAPVFSQTIWSKFLSLKALADKCKGQMDSLVIKATIEAQALADKTGYETDWTDKLQRLTKDFTSSVELNVYGRRIEMAEINVKEGFLYLYFKVRLTVISLPADRIDAFLFQHLNA